MKSLAILSTCLFVVAGVTNYACGGERPSQLGPSRLDVPASEGLTGRVVDASGRPVANARIAATPGANLPSREALRLETWSDEDGVYRFDEALRDTDYCLEFWAAAYDYQTATARAGQSSVIVLRPAAVHTLSGTVCYASSGEAAAGARVLLIGERVYRREVIASEGGRFEFDDVPIGIGQGVIYARHKGLYSEYAMIRRQTGSVDLTLDGSACLQGRCVTASSSTPIPGCLVTARPPFISGFSLETQTQSDGTYRFGPMPSGQYIAYARHSEWFQPPTRGSFLEPEEVRVGPGVTSAWDIAMHPKTRIEGTVLGPEGSPAANAIVAAPTAIEPIYSVLYDLTRTDEQGRFALYTHQLPLSPRNAYLNVAAFCDLLGAGVTRLTGSTEPDAGMPAYSDIEIRLAGRMRVSGHVTDSEGTPLSGISVYTNPNSQPARRTDASGFYDLGWFCLPPQPTTTITVTFRAPRPPDGEMHTLRPASERRPASPPDRDAVYGLHTTLTVRARHDRTVELDAVMARAELLTFNGAVTDASGLPVPQAQIMLFAGNVEPDKWLNEMHPERMRGGGIISHQRTYVPLLRTVADAEGRFALHVVRESRESLRIGHFVENVDPSLFSLGVESLDGAHLLLTDIRMSDDETEKDFKVDLP